MEIIAKLNNLRMSPRKVRLVANLIKGMDVRPAKMQLRFLSKRAAQPIGKLLDSAIANAENNFNLDKKNLYISKILVDSGATLKRWLPRAFGRATPIMKRTSRITIILGERTPTKRKRVAETRGKKKDAKSEKAPVSDKALDMKEDFLAEEKKEKSDKIKKEKRPFDASGKSKSKHFARQIAKRVFKRKSI